MPELDRGFSAALHWRRWPLWALLALLACGLSFGVDSALSDEAGYEKAVRIIRCDCGCHPQSIKECACGRAAEMRDDVRGMVNRGMSGVEIIADYVAKNGEQILLSPKATGFNLVAWLGPLFALVIAGPLMILMLRRWQRTRAETIAPAGAPAAIDPDDPYARRLRDQLRDLE